MNEVLVHLKRDPFPAPGTPGPSNKVATIKAFRAITGTSLKEAKDSVEAAASAMGFPVKLHGYGGNPNLGTTPMDTDQQISALEEAGFKVEVISDPNNPRDLLRTAAERELERGRFGPAAAITAILSKYYN